MVHTNGSLGFLERGSWPAHQRPYELLFQPPVSDFPVCNYSASQVPGILIHDMRSLKHNLSLDREGFMIADLDTKMKYEDYFDSEVLKKTYMPEIKALLTKEIGAKALYVHECVIRRSGGNEGRIGSFGQPIQNVHTDYTPDYALELLGQLTGNEVQAEVVQNFRIQMLNIWKPLKGPLRSWPLALCDLRSLNAEDVVTFDEVHVEGVLHSQHVIYNPLQKWYYLSNQEATEILVFKSMDTAVPGEVAHGSFFDPSCPDTEPPRESIELRILVVS